MPYFIIMPAYLILLVLLGTAAALTRRFPNVRWTSPYLAWGALGTLPGFILANLLGFLPLWISSHLSPPEWLRQLPSAP